MNRGTPARRGGLLSRLGVISLGIWGTDRRAGRQAFGRLSEGCDDPQNLVSKRSWPQAFHPQRLSRRTSGQWWISLSRQGRSARKHVGPVCPTAIDQSPTELPSLFPSGTPSCPHSGNQRPGCEVACQGGQDPPIPTFRSDWVKRREEQTHDELATLVIDILLQRNLTRVSNITATTSMGYGPDIPSSRLECPLPDHQVYRSWRHFCRTPLCSLVLSFWLDLDRYLPMP